MTKDQIDRLNMLQAVESHFNSNEPIWATNIPISEAKDALSDMIDQISTASTAQRNTSTGATMDKAALRKDLEEKGFFVSTALSAYSSTHAASKEQFKRLQIAKSGFAAFREPNLLDYIDDLNAAAMTEIEGLASYGVTQATLTALTTARSDFRDFKSEPEQVTSKRKTATDAIPVLMHQAIALLDENMDKLVELLRAVQPEFVSVYFNDRKIHSIGVRHLSLEILTLDANTNTPLEKADITIVGEGIKRVSSSKGYNRVQNLTQGNHQLSISRPGYASQIIPFIIISGETTQLVIEMQEIGTEVKKNKFEEELGE